MSGRDAAFVAAVLLVLILLFKWAKKHWNDPQ